MRLVRYFVSTLVGGLLCAAQLGAQATTGTITGRVVDSTSQQGIPSVNVLVEGTRHGALTRDDGSFTIGGVPVGVQRVRATRIGYAPVVRDVTVTAGTTVSVQFSLARQAAVLSEVVVTGYGTQRREAISGSVATVDASAANVGVVANATQMIQGRVAGVQMIQNSGEPGAGIQVRIRGGTSISASNEPLYVVDGVPLQNDEQAPGAVNIADIQPQLSRNPLNSINPSDIESITILKDASATAIYGSRGANGVVLIQTKRVAGGAGQLEYETYVGAATPTKDLGLASGAQYRGYVQQQVAIYTQDSLANRTPRRGLAPSTLASLGPADTDWEDELTRTAALATNHNLAFSGGSAATQYRASLNYFKQQGVVLANGLERYQGRLNATHDAFTGRLRLALNMMAARVVNDFAPVENGSGFRGGLFTNMLIYNPTFPVRCTDDVQQCRVQGRPEGSFFEMGSGAQDARNPVAMARQLQDVSPENRILGNLSGTVSVLTDLTAQTTLGIDFTDAARRTFAPRASPIGAQYGGYARQADRNLQNLNFQQLLTYTPSFGAEHDFEIVGGYEYTKFDNRGFDAQMTGFITDVFGVNALGAGTQTTSPPPTSYRVESRLASFFSRATYGFRDRYFLTGVIRYDGSSRLAEGRQWQTFPAISASWRLSREEFMSGQPFGISTLALRAGWGKQGNQSVDPYQTKRLLRVDPGAIYPIGNVLRTGLRAAQVGNPDLTWETAEQVNVGIDYGFMNDRFTGVIDFYQKTTKDLLQTVDVPQPAVVTTRIENIGSIRNRGIEATFNTPLISRGNRTLGLELVMTADRNRVINLGDTLAVCQRRGWWRQDPVPKCTSYLTGWVSGQGQSNQYSQRIMVGEPLGTFFAPVFIRVETNQSSPNFGKQIFRCRASSPGCTNGETTDAADADREVIGSGNPSFTLGLSNNATWGALDASWLWRAEFGGKVFNNTALVYQTKSAVTQGRNFLAAALEDPDDLTEPAKYSTRWIEDRTFVRLSNVTIGYTLPARFVRGRSTRVYVSGDNLLLLSDYSGYDPEVFTSYAGGIATRGVDYATYPRARTFTLGARFQW
jgi:TonB-linked SusC/RagA family outer membrane protein